MGLMVEASAAGNAAVIPDALLLGVCMGVLYDGFRIFRTAVGLRNPVMGGVPCGRLQHVRRRRIRSQRSVQTDEAENPSAAQTSKRSFMARCGGILQFFLDLLFALLCTAAIAVFFYWENAGELRWYLFAAMAAGFFSYYTTVGRVVMHTTAWILGCIRAVVLTIYNYSLFYFLMLLWRMGTMVWSLWSRGAVRVQRFFVCLYLKRRDKRWSARTERLCGEAEAYFQVSASQERIMKMNGKKERMSKAWPGKRKR